MRAIDLALETIPSGATTTLDTCWMGVPTLTLLGSTPAGRAARLPTTTGAGVAEVAPCTAARLEAILDDGLRRGRARRFGQRRACGGANAAARCASGAARSESTEQDEPMAEVRGVNVYAKQVVHGASGGPSDFARHDRGSRVYQGEGEGFPAPRREATTCKVTTQKDDLQRMNAVLTHRSRFPL